MRSRTRTAFFLLLLFLSGCYNSPSQEQTRNLTQPETTPSLESKSDDEEVDKNARDEKVMDESKSEAAILADALQQIQAGSAILVDVRRDEEWEEAHFEAARHIPLDTIDENAETAFADIDKQQTVFVH